jgi:Calcineurin-like phosphoesterase
MNPHFIHLPLTRRQALGVLATPFLAPLLSSCDTDALFSPSRPSFSASDLSITLIGAGDPHAKVNYLPSQRTGRLLQSLLNQHPGSRAFCVGDLTSTGTPEEFRYYQQTWGAFKDNTDFQIGNHDLLSDSTASAYYDYVGDSVGSRGKGYYAKTYGAWRVYYLNSQVGRAPQTTWLAEDLPKWAGYRIMAMWHQPQHASVCVHNGRAMTYDHGTGPWWDLLVKYGAELVVSGHVHRYERFAKLLRNGTVSAQGMRQFVVGTGGAKPMDILRVHPHSEYRIVTRGIFQLDLYGDRYEWRFIDDKGASHDSGVEMCRGMVTA